MYIFVVEHALLYVGGDAVRIASLVLRCYGIIQNLDNLVVSRFHLFHDVIVVLL